MAIIDALEEYAGLITTPDMTSELEGDMTSVSEGKKTQDEVVAQLARAARRPADGAHRAQG